MVLKHFDNLRGKKNGTFIDCWFNFKQFHFKTCKMNNNTLILNFCLFFIRWLNQENSYIINEVIKFCFRMFRHLKTNKK